MGARLTPTREKLLKKIFELSRNHPVSQAQVARAAGHSRAGMHDHLIALEKLGLLKIQRLTARSSVLNLSETGLRLIGQGAIPLVGEIAAGKPGVADPVRYESVTGLHEILDVRPGDFFLQVRGTSMIDIGIFPGDKVLVRPATAALEGEVVVVLLPGEGTATLKRWYREQDDVVLISENSGMQPMRFSADQVMIQGVLVGHVSGKPPRKSRNSRVTKE